MNHSTHWISADKQHEVFVLEDDPFWSSHTDVHKLAAVTGSFSFVRDENDKILDLSQIETLQNVSRALYLDNSWHQDATFEEIYEDLKETPASAS